MRAFRRNVHLSATIWGNSQIANNLVQSAERVIRGRRELIETDAEYDAAIQGIHNTNLSDEAKAEALFHLKKLYGTT
jgi:hypothetical protein